jgi:hypothetical protein
MLLAYACSGFPLLTNYIYIYERKWLLKLLIGTSKAGPIVTSVLGL